jgi:hypothetical protein
LDVGPGDLDLSVSPDPALLDVGPGAAVNRQPGCRTRRGFERRYAAGVRWVCLH